ncbi:phosphatidylinositol 4,5-bisphosphate 3-kinase catalytic subunit beta isoform isoform X3 [Eurytemora carolleeae]|uniref:phosphatidylinositol 4,5-bisphosphate 3-kinase catalytic subunit beta isoform isoform X3 n=1 Tax=Eurytemora carolleeae TaxID=1294199 RepID=UPI000C77A0F5|nr:phosphatidylinositol 4,5-bisphosphate 3-kinase catalytic subunit beta isoform isoform X3 [Eurytemora carolleeae]|eukprot:XP_023328992.1 phosphatidylinositol 4,5-bisphosphate 3-kinase catalytic subunit beta isoform-like isoform X3 [Eurytemora affinis]
MRKKRWHRIRKLSWVSPTSNSRGEDITGERRLSKTDLSMARVETESISQEKPSPCKSYHTRIRRIDPLLEKLPEKFINPETGELTLEILLPTGMLMNLVAEPQILVETLKGFIIDQILNSSEGFPLSGLMVGDPDLYTLSAISREGLLEELDDDISLEDVNLTQPIIKMSKLQQHQLGEIRVKKIGILVGKNLSQLENLQNTEIKDFRWRLQIFVLRIAQERKQLLEQDWKNILRYYFPPRIRENEVGTFSSQFSPQIESKLYRTGNHLWISVIKENGAQIKLKVSSDILPSQILELCKEDISSCLKINCREEFLVRECSLINYDTLRDLFLQGSEIILLVRTRSSLCLDMEPEIVDEDIYSDYQLRSKNKLVEEVPRSFNSVSSLRLQTRFLLLLDCLILKPELHMLKPEVYSDLKLRIGVYHGRKSLCSEVSLSFGERVKTMVDKHGTFFKYVLDQCVELDILVSNLPRMARLCFGLYRERKRRILPLAWVNTNIFDYKRVLKKCLTLHFWSYSDTESIHPCQSSVLQPTLLSEQNKNFKLASSLVFKFGNQKKGNLVEFPNNISQEEIPSSDELKKQKLRSENPTQSSQKETLRTKEPRISYTSKYQNEPGDSVPRSENPREPILLCRSGEPNLLCKPGESNLLCKPGEYNLLCNPEEPNLPCRPGEPNLLWKPQRRSLLREGSVLVPRLKMSKTFNEELQRIARRDQHHQMTEQEMILLLSLKDDCRMDHPRILPRIVDCVDYTNYQQVRDLHDLLERWPRVPVECALQLLDQSYPDQRVHDFAVQSLREGSDEELEMYLNHLVQAVKHQNFFHSSLVEFLLERTLKNQRLGHQFFWILRSQIRPDSAALKLPLVLEAYLLGAPGHMRILEKQRDFLRKLKSMSNCLEMYDRKGFSIQTKRKLFLENINKFLSPLVLEEGFICPLDPTLRCSRISLKSCSIMNSKKMPIKLVFQHYDSRYQGRQENQKSRESARMVEGNRSKDETVEDGENVPSKRICFMYKCGDDLRQDSLVLNIIKLMDAIWKQGGVDYKMNSYQCVPTSHNEGLIEIVPQAQTICQIQMEESSQDRSGDRAAWTFKYTAVFQRELLYRWICRHNPENLSNALENFKLSLAGYTVAMYVLGIGDRHNDNIMLQTCGKLFHIDFGHMVGNFKSKMGINRERSPMILPPMFLFVIEQIGPEQFQVFRNLCEKGYLMLRECGSLIVSLLAMMVFTGSGLPDLQSVEDLEYIRHSLQLDDNIDDEGKSLIFH